MTKREFWANVKVGGPHECWPWLCSTVKGHGQVRFWGRVRRAHRVAWYLVNGEWPVDTLDHTCHSLDLTCKGGDSCPHRKCCNPAHLQDVSVMENWMRGRQWRFNHCVRGHLFDEKNTYRKCGRRYCRTCVVINQLAYRQRLRDARFGAPGSV